MAFTHIQISELLLEVTAQMYYADDLRSLYEVRSEIASD